MESIQNLSTVYQNNSKSIKSHITWIRRKIAMLSISLTKPINPITITLSHKDKIKKELNKANNQEVTM